MYKPLRRAFMSGLIQDLYLESRVQSWWGQCFSILMFVQCLGQRGLITSVYRCVCVCLCGLLATKWTTFEDGAVREVAEDVLRWQKLDIRPDKCWRSSFWQHSSSTSKLSKRGYDLWHTTMSFSSLIHVCRLFPFFPQRPCPYGEHEFRPCLVWSHWTRQYPGTEGTLGEKTQPYSCGVAADRTALLRAAGAGDHGRSSCNHTFRHNWPEPKLS